MEKRVKSKEYVRLSNSDSTMLACIDYANFVFTVISVNGRTVNESCSYWNISRKDTYLQKWMSSDEYVIWDQLNVEFI